MRGLEANGENLETHFLGKVRPVEVQVTPTPAEEISSVFFGFLEDTLSREDLKKWGNVNLRATRIS